MTENRVTLQLVPNCMSGRQVCTADKNKLGAAQRPLAKVRVSRPSRQLSHHWDRASRRSIIFFLRWRPATKTLAHLCCCCYTLPHPSSVRIVLDERGRVDRQNKNPTVVVARPDVRHLISSAIGAGTWKAPRIALRQKGTRYNHQRGKKNSIRRNRGMHEHSRSATIGYKTTGRMGGTQSNVKTCGSMHACSSGSGHLIKKAAGLSCDRPISLWEWLLVGEPV